MQKKLVFRKKLLARLVLGSLIVSSHAVMAQSSIDLGTVQSNGGGSGSSAPNIESAPYQAPTQGSLIATEPKSIITQQYIQQNASAGSNYTDIVNIAPAVSSMDPNGPGLMETTSLTLRGFEDGQFNVTFDGIPWGDSNDFTHHSTSYFMAQDLGGISIDRGPGNASNIGDATFGGTIAVNSKNPGTETSFTPYATCGSYNTRLAGVEFDTGVMKNYGDLSAVIDYKQLTSDGFLTNAGMKRNNLFIKLMKPISGNTMLTFVAMNNTIHQNTTGNNGGTSLAMMQKYGYNAGLVTDPTSQSYFGYNYDNINSNMEYVDINSDQGSWNIDNKLYTYSYNHTGYQGTDVGGVVQANGTTVGGVAQPNDVPGTIMYMNYTSWGDTLRATMALGQGELATGIWIDRQTNGRGLWNVDMSLGGATVNNPYAGGRLMTDTLTTIQPYVQYAWKMNDKLTITPGLKYSSFARSFNAPIMPGTGGNSYYGSATYSKLLPSIDAHYMIQPNWSAYAQYAQGFLAPVMQAFQVVNVNPSTILPTETENYQIGTTWKSEKLTVSGDIYKIVSKNWMQPGPLQNGMATYMDAGNVDFSGVEGEATYYVGSGFSLYGNDALINYNIKNPAAFGGAVVGGNAYAIGNALNNVPRNTATAGVIYNQGSIYASLLAKEIGRRVSGVDTTGNAMHFGGYTITNLNTNYTLKNVGGWFHDLKVGLQVNNLFNKNAFLGSGGNDVNGNPLFYVIPDRNYELSLSLSM
ncbi:MAG: TonB-dependent receptor [Burkholderiales bacterium]|nr:TonB-dependent receptor [Burkholderiales bacterium]